MNKETLEHVSSLMDGELTRETSLFLTRRLCTDKELTGTWERYHLIRDCIRQSGTRTPLVGLSQRMQIALLEEIITPVSSGKPNRWLRAVSGFAVAASVALLAIVTIGPQQVSQNADVVAVPAVESFSSPNVLPIAPKSQAASFSQGRDERLNPYLLRHNQTSGSITTQGFLGFVPIVSSAENSDSQVEEPENSEGEAELGDNK
ncbi:MAG: sigma-E factor negative regulatory protein RseA [Lysobacterales bacterium]|jgi:sigma-E factor negative regulatory protein RseA